LRWFEVLFATGVEVEMNPVIVAVFLNEMAAKQGAQALRDMCTGGPTTLIGLSVVSKDSRGKLTVAEGYHERTHGAVVAAFICALAGWVAGGPMAALIFAAGGALIGLSADLIHHSGHIELVERVSSKLSTGKSAVIAHLSEATNVNISAMMKSLGGKVIPQST
jgi:uncharacterized membrane protein